MLAGAPALCAELAGVPRGAQPAAAQATGAQRVWQAARGRGAGRKPREFLSRGKTQGTAKGPPPRELNCSCCLELELGWVMESQLKSSMNALGPVSTR